jgi:hypothetical protein
MGKDPRRRRVRKGERRHVSRFHALTHCISKVFADATLVFPLLVAATFARDVRPP